MFVLTLHRFSVCVCVRACVCVCACVCVSVKVGVKGSVSVREVWETNSVSVQAGLGLA